MLRSPHIRMSLACSNRRGKEPMWRHRWVALKARPFRVNWSSGARGSGWRLLLLWHLGRLGRRAGIITSHWIHQQSFLDDQLVQSLHCNHQQDTSSSGQRKYLLRSLARDTSGAAEPRQREGAAVEQAAQRRSSRTVLAEAGKCGGYEGGGGGGGGGRKEGGGGGGGRGGFGGREE